MADNLIANPGSGGATFRTDDLGGVPAVHVPYTKILLGGDGVDGGGAPGDTANGIDVDVTRLPALVAGTANIGDVDVLTVPAPLSTTGGGTEATALRVTVASDSTGVLSVDDNGASLTVDGTVTANNTTPANLKAQVQGEQARDVGIASNNPVLAGARASTATPTAVSADGDVVDLWANLNGALRIDPVGTTTQPVSIAATVTVDTEFPAAETPADNLTNATAAPRVNSLLYGFDGTTWDRIRGDSANGLQVDLGTNNDVVVSGTVTANAGTGTFTTQDTSSLVDNAGFTDGTSRVLPSGYVFDDVAGTALTENDIAAARIDSKRTLLSVIEDPTTRGLRATVRDLAANDALNVAIVDGSGNQITSFGGGTQYTEDAVAATDPVGTTPVMTRRDSPTSLVSANLDVISQQATQYGAAYVQVVNSTGSFVDTFGGGTQYTEDAVSAADPVGNQLISRRRDALASEVSADGDVIAVNSTSKGELYVKHVDAIPVTDNGGSLTIDGTVTANAGTGTFTTQDTSSLVDNAAFTDGTSRVLPAGYVFDDVAGTALTENDIAAARIDSKRTLLSVIEDPTTRGLRATVRDLASNDALNVAIVDGSGGQITSFGGGTQYTEDAVAATDPVGTTPVLTRRDTPTSIVSANLDVISQQATQYGAAYVQVVSSTGSFVDTFGGGTQFAEDAGHTTGDVGTVALAVRRDADTSAVSADADYGTLTLDDASNLKVTFGSRDATGALNALNAAVTVDTKGNGHVSMQVLTGTLVGSITAEVSNDNSNWTAATFMPLSGAQSNTILSSFPATAFIRGAGFRYVRVRVSAYTSGTSDCFLHTTGSTTFHALERTTDTIGDVTVSAFPTNLVITDNAAFTDGTTKLIMSGHVLDETAGTALTENDAAASRIDSKRAQMMVIEDSSVRGQKASVQPGGGLSATLIGVSGTAAALQTSPPGSTSAGLVVRNLGTIADNAPFAMDTDNLQAVGYVFDEVAGTALTENDASYGRIDSKRAIIHVLEDATTRGQRATVTAANALKVDNSAVTQPVSGSVTVSGNKTNNSAAPGATNVGTLPGVATASAPTYTEGNQVALSTDLSGALRVTGGGGGVQYVEDVASTGGETMTLAGAIVQSTPVKTADEGDFTSLKTDSVGKLHTTSSEDQPIRNVLEEILTTLQSSEDYVPQVRTPGNSRYVTLAPDTQTGYLTYRLLSAGTTNATSVKNTNGSLYGWAIYNTNAAARYVKLYDTATLPIVGTQPKMTLMVPGASAGAGNNFITDAGIPFNNGIGFVTVNNPADSDGTAVASNDLIINLFYL